MNIQEQIKKGTDLLEKNDVVKYFVYTYIYLAMTVSSAFSALVFIYVGSNYNSWFYWLAAFNIGTGYYCYDNYMKCGKIYDTLVKD